MRALSLPILAVSTSLAADPAPIATFNAPRTFSVGYPILSIATADFDGDGTPDVAALTEACEYCQGAVSILLNNGHGGFQPERDHPVGTSFLGPTPQALAVGDFNGDGKPDLVAVNGGDSTISILLNRGGGSFSGQRRYQLGCCPGAVAVGDFNGDGKLDLVVNVGPTVSGGYTILLGNGDGTFGSPVAYSAQSTVSIAVGDFNGDGKEDLALLGAGTVSIALGNGDGTFQKPVSYATGGTSSTFVATGDFNGDGKLDLAVASGSGVSILFGGGDGTFGLPQMHSVPGALSLAVADLNGDGIPDIAVAGTTTVNDNNVLSVLLGSGGGNFRPALILNVPGAPQSIAVADVNGDGNPDLVVGEDQFAVAVLAGNGSGQFQQAPAGYPAAYYMVAADFNSDGKLDIAGAGYSGIVIMLGNGDGTFQPPIVVTKRSGGLAVGDLNGDGKPDLVITRDEDYGHPGTVTVMLGHGDGTFGPPMTFAGGLEPTSAIVGDFNGDGKMDVAVVNAAEDSQPGTVSVLLGNGDGTLQAPLSSAAGLAPGWAIPGDFNNDGKLDLAVAGFVVNTVSILIGNGDGTFQALPAFVAPPMRMASMAAADFNGDGNLDLALGGEGTGSVYVLPGNGNGTFQAGASFNVASNVDWLGVGDFNGDGKLDLAVMGDITATVSILLGEGDATFRASRNYLVGNGSDAVIGAFNNAALPDIVVSTTSTAVLANTTPQGLR
jgi:hypothetical protein